MKWFGDQLKNGYIFWMLLVLPGCDSNGGDGDSAGGGKTCYEAATRNELQSSSPDSTLDSLLQIEKGGCSNPQLFSDIGRELMIQRRFDEALSYFNRSLSQSKIPEALLLRARSKYELHDYEGAIEDYGSFLQSHGDLSEYYSNLLEPSGENGHEVSAHHPTVSDSRIVEALNNSGYSAMYLEKFELAETFFQKLADLEPDSIIADVGLAQTYFYWGCDGCNGKAGSIASELLSVPSVAEMYGDILDPIVDGYRAETDRRK